jgi:hypothetical protein
MSPRRTVRTLHTVALAVAVAGSVFAADDRKQPAPTFRATPHTPAPSPATAQTPAAPPATMPQVPPGNRAAPQPTAGNTPRTGTMTPQEQQQHREDLQRAKTGDECRAVVARQREAQVQRAKERGETPPNKAGSDPCVGR